MKLSVDVIFDVICPWCYVGKRRLEKAFAASVKDGYGVTLNRRIFEIETSLSGDMTSRDVAYLRDIIPAPAGTTGPAE